MKYTVEGASCGMINISNYMKIDTGVQKVGGGDIYTDTQKGDLKRFYLFKYGK
jgi:hypothetical protein